LGTYLSYDQLPEEINILISRKKPDRIFLFIRPFPLLPLQKPLIRYESGNNRISYAWHPAFFSRRLKWKSKLTKNQSADDFKFIKKSAFGLRDINLLAGMITGLHHWMLKYLAGQLDSIRLLCNAAEIKLCVISPPQTPGSIIANRFSLRTSSYLEKFCQKEQLDFINISSLGPDNFEEDKVHFNRSGHRKLAEVIYEYLVK
jgi:hypothetical protein